MAIKRIWRGWTAIANADEYWRVLTGTTIPRFEAKSIEGFGGVEVLREL
jgi:hypothetical protein